MHNKHACTDVNTAAEEFGAQLKVDMDKISASCIENQTKIDKMNTDRDGFVEKVTVAQNKVSEKCDELVSLIRARQCQLIAELSLFKETRLKKMEECMDDVKKQCAIMEGFHGYCQEIRDNGTACDVSSSANDLHVRAEELVKIQEGRVCYDLNSVDFTFVPSFAAQTTDAVTFLIGKLSFKGLLS